MNRYKEFTKVVQFNEYSFLPSITRSFKYSGPVKLHQVKPGEELYLISYIHYNTPDYFWAIAMYNNITNPFMDIDETTTLEIPINIEEIVKEMRQ